MSWNWCQPLGKHDFWAKICSRAKIAGGGSRSPPQTWQALSDVKLVRVNGADLACILCPCYLWIVDVIIWWENLFWSSKYLMEKSSIVKGNGSYHHSQLVKMNIQAMFCPSPKFPHSLVDEVLSALKRPGPLFQWVIMTPSGVREKFSNKGFFASTLSF